MTDQTNTQEEGLFDSLAHKYVPYWPMFLILFMLAMAGAWAYLHYLAIPTYETSATIIIKDEKKGVDESRMTQSIDAFTSNNIVENEIKVIQSRALTRQVIDDLGLYAPFYEEDKFKAIPAYSTSPIKVRLKIPEQAKEVEKVYFTFDKATQQVKIDGKKYPLNTWAETPYGEMMFLPNDKQSDQAELPLYFSIVHPKKVTDGIISSLSIQAENKLSTAVNLNFTDASPARGEDILNKLIEEYNQVAIDKRNDLAAKTLDYVNNRIILVGKELKELENQMVQYKSSRGVVDLSEQGKMYLSSVGESDRNLSDINLQLAILSEVEQYVMLKSNSAGMAPSTLGIKDPGLTQLLQKLYDSEIQYQRLKGTTAENNPVLLSVVSEIEQIRPSILDNIRNQRRALQASRASMASTSSRYNSQLQTIPRKERELLEISRQQATKNDAYNFLLQKREETVLSYAPTDEDTRIVDMAESSLYPVAPRSLYIYLIAAVMSCVLGVVMISGREMMNGKLLFLSEILSNTDIPVVAELQYTKTKDKLHQKPTDGFVIEEFRHMRATIGLFGRTFVKKKIMITSSIAGEGKTYVSTNLAHSLASSGRKVALLDFDLRNPSTTRLFNLTNYKGITEYLMEDIEPYQIINSTESENLYVVPAGVFVGDSTELLLNGKLEDLFSYLENEFDYILVDTAPADIISGASILTEFCNMTLLIMRHGYTPKALVKRLPKNNKFKFMNNMAIVFNGVKPRGLFKGHHGIEYGYGYELNYGNNAYLAKNT
ncbi:capsular biosynthesis protein [Rufibacter sp. DG15C]|uniref:GumC family protein n=1 Tax=Rufibacter sp. DG15C TaxID=1379909 RepID=UPI00078B4A09|nr:tyrosine-protein kinase family protein [Rufibacter sp. DG15C]AMM51465.1 capsular biosynthesis protein [Rufibacter sp. DG15C]